MRIHPSACILVETVIGSSRALGQLPRPSSSPSTIHDDGDYQPLAATISVGLLGITVPRGPTRRAAFVPVKALPF